MSKRHGLIVIGYPGIGKTTVANADKPYSKIIDLESSVFTIENDKIENWYIPYCKMAVDIASQGYIVLVSSHAKVQHELGFYNPDRNDITIVSISPTVFIKDEWINRLRDRYLNDKTPKNERAWKQAEKFYIDDIHALSTNPDFSHIYLPNEHYDLYKIIMSIYDIYSNDRRQGIVE